VVNSLLIGTLDAVPVSARRDLLAAPVGAALDGWPGAGEVGVAEIDPSLADTAALVAAHQVPAEASANCVVVAGRREGVERVAACVVLATTRADVNGLIRRLLDVRKASFLSVDRAVAETGMEYGGITALGVPAGWRVLVDARVPLVPTAVIGSGIRRSKLVLPGRLLAELPGAEVIEDLALPA
jgi:prolyl-tRNA editing enzyme YbaK/EbsC (Cys-tRNA(Pro) deacylase)